VSNKGANPVAERLTAEPSQKGDHRSDFQRDRDIVLYTSAFKRLSGITQVVSSHTGHVFHNRLTHSLQVAQVGRSLAEKLLKLQEELAKGILLEPHAVEAACLAHDLGHPPFGHIAEEILNDQVGDDAEGYEGNAQSFRIVTELAFRSSDFAGLNLTRATLKGILKYPWTFAKRPVGAGGKPKKKWGAYATAAKQFEFATGSVDGGPTNKAIEAELMDWADDLTYAIHDVEDFYRAGLIPLHQMNSPAEPDKESMRFLEYVNSKKESIPEFRNLKAEDLRDVLTRALFPLFTLQEPYQGTRNHRARLRIFTSQMVGLYINALELVKTSGAVEVQVAEQRKQEIAILKQLTWFYVIEAPSLAIQQAAQKKMVEYLFGVFFEECRKQPHHLLPPYYQERLSGIPTHDPDRRHGMKRMVADLIAGMTEAQAVALYQRLNGMVTGSAFEKILG